MDAKHFIDFLRLYRTITDDDAAVIANALQYRNVKAGTVLLEAGAISKELFFILQGILKIVVLNEKGNLVTYYFLKENLFCTILGSFNAGTVTDESIVAATDAQLLFFTKQNLEGLYAQLSYFREMLAAIMQEMLLYKIQVKNSYMGLDAAERYHKFVTQQSDIALCVSLGDVASYLNITQQSLSRIRKNKP